MGAQGNEFPPLSGDLENSATTNTNQRIMNANHDARQLLNHISSKGIKIPKKVLDYIKGVEDLTCDLIKNPIGQDWKHQFELVHQETMQIRKDLQAVRIATTVAAHSQATASRVRSYADATRNAPPPSHFVSNSSSTPSTHPATPSDLIHDRQIIVKLGDPEGIRRFRTYTPSEITKLADKARVKGAKEAGPTDGMTMAAARFIAAKQLKSGDVSLTLQSAMQAEVMRCHRLVWVKHLWKGSEVRLPSWGVVVHGVNVKSLGVNTPGELATRKQEIMKLLLTENLYQWGEAEITQISWLMLPEGKKSGSLIVEFALPTTANQAIDTGTLWDSEVLATVKYDRAARIRQCHNCQRYGHIGTTCSNPTRCVFCAAQHHSRDCQDKKNATLIERKCANCGGAHNGWSKRCPDFVKEIERIQILAQHRERYHRVPAYLTISPQREGSTGGSGSGASMTAPSSDGINASTMASSSGGSKASSQQQRPVQQPRRVGTGSNSQALGARSNLARQAPAQTSGQNCQTQGRAAQTQDRISQTQGKSAQTSNGNSQTPTAVTTAPMAFGNADNTREFSAASIDSIVQQRRSTKKPVPRKGKTVQAPSQDTRTRTADVQTPVQDFQTPVQDVRTPEHGVQTPGSQESTTKATDDAMDVDMEDLTDTNSQDAPQTPTFIHEANISLIGESLRRSTRPRSVPSSYASSTRRNHSQLSQVLNANDQVNNSPDPRAEYPTTYNKTPKRLRRKSGKQGDDLPASLWQSDHAPTSPTAPAAPTSEYVPSALSETDANIHNEQQPPPHDGQENDIFELPSESDDHHHVSRSKRRRDGEMVPCTPLRFSKHFDRFAKSMQQPTKTKTTNRRATLNE
jgi:hypothetical protein